MSHRLYKRRDDTYAFVSTQKEWHGKGPVADGPMTATEAMQKTGLDQMRLSSSPLRTTFEGVDYDVDSHVVVMLDDTQHNIAHPAAVVSKSRLVTSFIDLAQPLDDLVRLSGGGIETFGLFDSGADWFGAVLMPENVVIGGDEHKIYAFGGDSLRGSFFVAATAQRVCCRNTYDAALLALVNEAKPYRYVMRHTSGASVDVDDIRAALGMTTKYVEAMNDMADVLLAQPFTAVEFDNLTDTLFGTPEEGASGRAIQSHVNRKARLKMLFSGLTETTETTFRDYQPTKWTALQAIGEYVDWYAPVRGGDPMVRRLERTMDSSVNRVKSQALLALR